MKRFTGKIGKLWHLLNRRYTCHLRWYIILDYILKIYLLESLWNSESPKSRIFSKEVRTTPPESEKLKVKKKIWLHTGNFPKIGQIFQFLGDFQLKAGKFSPDLELFSTLGGFLPKSQKIYLRKIRFLLFSVGILCFRKKVSKGQKGSDFPILGNFSQIGNFRKLVCATTFSTFREEKPLLCGW